MAADAPGGVAGWLRTRAGFWRACALRVDRAASRRIGAGEALEVTDDYRAIGADLAAARVHLPGQPATAALERLFLRLHTLHRPARPAFGEALRDLILIGIPASFHRVRPIVSWCAAWFGVCVLAGAWLVHWQPELAGLFMSESMIEGVESGTVWTDQVFGVVPPGMSSLQILTNNIVVALMGLVFGLFLGLGAIYLLGLNGLMLGAAFAFTANYGLSGNLGRFVIAHGFVELSVICLSVAAGTYVGDAIIRPRGLPRATALKVAVGEVLPLIGLCCVLLVGCGLIEGYLSPDPDFPVASRLVVGIGWWLVMAGLLAGPRAPAPSDAPSRA